MAHDNDNHKTQAPITYRDAGVDIDAGNALVGAIKPLAKSTSRTARTSISAASAVCST